MVKEQYVRIAPIIVVVYRNHISHIVDAALLTDNRRCTKRDKQASM